LIPWIVFRMKVEVAAKSTYLRRAISSWGGMGRKEVEGDARKRIEIRTHSWDQL
jgi:hypothetical protein